MLSGKVMRQKVVQRLAPRLRAASSSEGWMLLMMPISESTMKGRVNCTSPTTAPKKLYISGSGSRMTPRSLRTPLMIPLSPISTIRPKSRITMSSCIALSTRIM